MTLAHLIAICMAVTLGIILIKMGMEFNEQIQQVFQQNTPTKP